MTWKLHTNHLLYVWQIYPSSCWGRNWGEKKQNNKSVKPLLIKDYKSELNNCSWLTEYWWLVCPTVLWCHHQTAARWCKGQQTPTFLLSPSRVWTLPGAPWTQRKFGCIISAIKEVTYSYIRRLNVNMLSVLKKFKWSTKKHVPKICQTCLLSLFLHRNTKIIY